MKKIAVMTFELEKNNKLSSAVKKELIDFKAKLKKYAFGALMYKISIDHTLFLEAEEYVRLYKKDIFFEYYIEAKYSEREMEKAIAYIPEFKRICNEYDDSEDVFEYKCSKCITYDQVKDLEIRPTGAIKKYKDDYATFVNEVYEMYLVSVRMQEHLIKNGIEPKYLRPVYTKKDKVNPLAYQLYSENILPQGAFINPCVSAKVCPECKNVHTRYSSRKKFAPCTVSDTGLYELEPVNLSFEYNIKKRTVLVSKKMYELMKEKDPKAKFEPVFLKE